MSITIRITKGCPSANVHKGQTFTVDPKSYVGVGVRVGGPLWLSGNRHHVPDFKVGDVLKMNDGRPEHSVRAVVLSVGETRP